MPTSTPIYPQAIKNDVLTLNNASGTTASTLTTAGTNGTGLYSIIVTSSDTSDRDIILNAVVSSTTYPMAILKIPATSGTVNTVASVNYLNQAQIPLAIDAFGNPVLYIGSGTSLTVAAGTTITSGKAINFVVQKGDF